MWVFEVSTAWLSQMMQMRLAVFVAERRGELICILVGFLTLFICVASFYVLLDYYGGRVTPAENSASPIDYQNLVQSIRTSMLYDDDQNYLRRGEKLLGRPLSTEEITHLLDTKSEYDKKFIESGLKNGCTLSFFLVFFVCLVLSLLIVMPLVVARLTISHSRLSHLIKHP